MINRAAASVALTCLLATVCSCSSHAGPNGRRADESLRAQGAASTGTTAVPAGGSGFDLVNFTGSTLRAVYISPSDSKGWEENLLGGDELNDGNTVKIRFSPEERAVLWDIRVEGTDEHYAEWRGLDLSGVSRITLMLDLVSEPVVVAEVE